MKKLNNVMNALLFIAKLNLNKRKYYGHSVLIRWF